MSLNTPKNKTKEKQFILTVQEFCSSGVQNQGSGAQQAELVLPRVQRQNLSPASLSFWELMASWDPLVCRCVTSISAQAPVDCTPLCPALSQQDSMFRVGLSLTQNNLMLRFCITSTKVTIMGLGGQDMDMAPMRWMQINGEKNQREVSEKWPQGYEW